MAKQTAVEWLMEQYKNNPYDCLIKTGLFEQAKEMEREQKYQAYKEAIEMAKGVINDELKNVFVLPKNI